MWSPTSVGNRAVEMTAIIYFYFLGGSVLFFQMKPYICTEQTSAQSGDIVGIKLHLCSVPLLLFSALESKLETTFQTPSTGLRHPSWRCRKAMLGVWLTFIAVSLLQFGCQKVNLKLHLCSVSLLQFRCLKVNLKLHLCAVFFYWGFNAWK